MSSVINTNHKYYDYINHVDQECKNIFIPYMNNIQRSLLKQYPDQQYYYRIPTVIKSICCAYFCKHLYYRLSFKNLFESNQYPTYQHFLSQHHESNKNLFCTQYNFEQCPSIQRLIFILTNFQSYIKSINSSQECVTPYVTYKYYQLNQILQDMEHINTVHSTNSTKFYIKNSIIEYKSILSFDGDNECVECNHNHVHIDYKDDGVNDEKNSEQCMEQCLKYNLLQIHNEYIHHSLSKTQFENAVSDIVTYNGSMENIFDLLNVLRSVSRKLLKSDSKYRTLDTSNPRVQARLLGYDGVINFLSLLGFESNALGNKLVCQHQPSVEVIKNAISTIDAYHPQRRPIPYYNYNNPVVPISVIPGLPAIQPSPIQPSLSPIQPNRVPSFSPFPSISPAPSLSPVTPVQITMPNVPQIQDNGLSAIHHVHIQDKLDTDQQQQAESSQYPNKRNNEEKKQDSPQSQPVGPIMVQMMNTMMTINPLCTLGDDKLSKQYDKNISREIFEGLSNTNPLKPHLRVSSTEYIDVDIEIAIAAELDDDEKDNNGILNWFGGKLKKMKPKGNKKKKRKRKSRKKFGSKRVR